MLTMGHNCILKALNPNDADWLRPRLKPVEVKPRDELENPNELVESVFFIETGIAAAISISGKTRIAIGLIGCEGASGLPLILGDTHSSYSTVMLSEGTALCLTTSALHHAMERRPELRRLFLRYVLAFNLQVAHTALSNAKGSVQQRVARWVLMTHDRVAKHDIPLSHELIASMIGIRRAGVSVVLAQFQKSGLIDVGRGHVHVLNRRGIRDIAGDFYGAPEKEFARLIGR
jgi:CRP-like cAMP-binding protein